MATPLFKAVSSYPPRSIRVGETYELEPDDVLVKAGVVRPLTSADEADAPADVSADTPQAVADEVAADEAVAPPERPVPERSPIGLHYEHVGGGWFEVRRGPADVVDKVQGKAAAEARLAELAGAEPGGAGSDA